MQDKAAIEKRNAAAKILTRMGVKYEVDGDVLVVPGDIDLNSRGLTALPDLSCVEVAGNFSCGNNRLTTLKGAPFLVKGDFDCTENFLSTLDGSPRCVNGHYRCYLNRLTSLEGGPDAVFGSFLCDQNLLQTLKGAPKIVFGTFRCRTNRLETLEGAPCTVIESDFGRFTSWDRVPGNLRWSEASITATTVAQAPIAVRRPLAFKR